MEKETNRQSTRGPLACGLLFRAMAASCTAQCAGGGDSRDASFSFVLAIVPGEQFLLDVPLGVLLQHPKKTFLRRCLVVCF